MRKRLLAIMLLATPTWAATVLTNGTVAADLAAWLATTGASPTAALPDVGAAVGAQTVGSLGFTAINSQLYFGSGGNPAGGWSTLISGNEIALNNEDFDIDIASPVYSFGFVFHEPSISGSVSDRCGNIGCVDALFSISLFNGANSVASFQFNGADDVANFIGVHSDSAFNRVLIRDLSAASDNEFFGQFYTGTQPLQLTGGNVPEPGSALLLATGLAGMLAAARRRARSNPARS